MRRPDEYVPRTAWRVTVPPAVEPLTAAEARAVLGTDPDDDAELTRRIRVAREAVEAYVGRALITQTIALQLDAFPGPELPWWDGVRQGSIRAFTGGAPITLPRPPLIAVTSFTYRGGDGTNVSVDAGTYRVDDISEPGRLLLQPGSGWPSVTEDRAVATITYTAGYGDDAGDLPAVFADAILAQLRDTLQRPDLGVTSRRIDNVQTTWADGTADASGAALRASARQLLYPWRILQVG